MKTKRRNNRQKRIKTKRQLKKRKRLLHNYKERLMRLDMILKRQKI